MFQHQYACPECGRTLQSAQDVAGRQIKCLGCQAVFEAAPVQQANVSPPAAAAPAPRPEPEDDDFPPPRRARERDDYLPPRSKSKFPVVPVVIGGAVLVAILLTVGVIIILGQRKDRTDSESNAVVQAAIPKKSAPAS